jgi:hypothetical protein
LLSFVECKLWLVNLVILRVVTLVFIYMFTVTEFTFGNSKLYPRFSKLVEKYIGKVKKLHAI